jgi:hypothetical protein
MARGHEVSRPVSDLPSGIGAPASRALAAAGYSRLADLAKVTEAEVKRLHGMGPKAFGKIQAALAAKGLSFRDPSPRVKRPPSKRETTRRVLTWKSLLQRAATLPGIEEGVCFGTPALYVRKRFLARLREDGETVAIKVDFIDRDVLLEADPAAFFLTDHYRAYPMVLMRLRQTRPAMAEALLEQAWRRAASKKLLAEQASRDATAAKKGSRRSTG